MGSDGYPFMLVVSVCDEGDEYGEEKERQSSKREHRLAFTWRDP